MQNLEIYYKLGLKVKRCQWISSRILSFFTPPAKRQNVKWRKFTNDKRYFWNVSNYEIYYNIKINCRWVRWYFSKFIKSKKEYIREGKKKQ